MGGQRARSGADIFFDKKYPRLPEIVTKEGGATPPLIDALRCRAFYENKIPATAAAAAAAALNSSSIIPFLSPSLSLSQQSLWLPHGSACPSPDLNPQPRPQLKEAQHSVLLGLLAIIFVLVLIVVLIAAIVILADRIKTLWRKTRCEEVVSGDGGLLISSWGLRVRRTRSRRTKR